MKRYSLGFAHDIRKCVIFEGMTNMSSIYKMVETPDGEYVKHEDAKELIDTLMLYAKHRNDGNMMCERLKHDKYPCTCGFEAVVKKYFAK